MTLRIGMIGPGGMGQAHIDRINTVIAGGQLVAISDIAPDNVATVSAKYGVTGYDSSAELIADESVVPANRASACSTIASTTGFTPASAAATSGRAPYRT